MRKWLIAMCVWALAANGAPVWTWTDANGQVHYSDRPVPGARQIDLPEAASRPARPGTASPAPSVAAPRQAAGEQAGPRHPYRAFLVVSPTQQQTLWNIGATLTVELRLDPPLRDDHRIDVYFDGERRNLDTTALQFPLPEVHRGTHTLQAAIVDSDGEVLLRSLPVTFMVQQTSILNPNNPNAPPRRVPTGR